MFFRLFFLGVALCGTNAAATTYYIDSVSGDDSHNGTSPFTPWQTLAKVGKSQFAPGDQILLKRGQTWRETLSLQSSGTDGNPIVIDAYGDGNPPIISGADPASEWAQYKGNIYQAYVGVRPHIVLFDGILGTQQANLAALTAPNQWHWAAGSLYIYSSVDPETAYTKPDIVAGSRSNCIVLSSAAYATVRNITVTGGNGGSGEIYANGLYGAKGIEIRRVNAENGAGDGIRFDNLSVAAVDASTIAFMGRNGIASYRLTNVTITNNHIYDNGTGIYLHQTDNSEVAENIISGSTQTDQRDTGYCLALSASRSNIVEKNLCDQSRLALLEIMGGAKDSGSSGNTVRYNVLRDGRNHGIDVSVKSAQKNEFYGNLIYNLPFGDGAIIKSSGNKLFNNTIYNVLNGIVLDSRDAANASIKNNIVAQAKNFNIQVVSPARGFEADNNDYQSDGAGKFEWGENAGNFSRWRQSSRQDAHSFIADPKFNAWTPSAPGDFKLASNSPDIDSGAALAPPYNLCLSDHANDFPFPPADQNSFGKGWEIGAFVYTAGK